MCWDVVMWQKLNGHIHVNFELYAIYWYQMQPMGSISRWKHHWVTNTHIHIQLLARTQILNLFSPFLGCWWPFWVLRGWQIKRESEGFVQKSMSLTHNQKTCSKPSMTVVTPKTGWMMLFSKLNNLDGQKLLSPIKNTSENKETVYLVPTYPPGNNPLQDIVTIGISRTFTLINLLLSMVDPKTSGTF